MIEFSESLQKHFDEINNILKGIGERVEGNFICDITPDNLVYNTNIDKIKNLQNLAKRTKHICEIGVNAGHSLLLMIDESPNAEYELFDLGDHEYTRPCMEYIQQSFPNTKIKITYGDSKKTLKEFIINNSDRLGAFDLIHIDGGHELMEFTNDFYYTSLLGGENCLYIFDDYNYPNIKKFLEDRLSLSIIEEVNEVSLTKTPRHLIYKFSHD
jgi:hypothetical protein